MTSLQERVSNLQCPSEYYICHAVIALLIAVVLSPILGVSAGLAAGAAFYVGREFTQWTMGLPFDWKGLLSPVLVNGALLIAYNIYF